MPYQIRYSVEEEEVSAIFEESEIAKRFHEALKGKEQFLEDYTSKVKDFLAPLIKRKKLKSRVLTASNPALAPDFVNGVQYGILYSAIDAVTSKKQFNVKQSILTILSNPEAMEYFLKARICIAFNGITEYQYMDELEEFLKDD